MASLSSRYLGIIIQFHWHTWDHLLAQAPRKKKEQIFPCYNWHTYNHVLLVAFHMWEYQQSSSKVQILFHLLIHFKPKYIHADPSHCKPISKYKIYNPQTLNSTFFWQGWEWWVIMPSWHKQYWLYLYDKICSHCDRIALF
jgi:hypothetical protein